MRVVRVDRRVRLFTKEGHHWTDRYPWIVESASQAWFNDSVTRRPIADEGRVSCRKPALLHHAALATFSGPACSMARM